MAFFYKKKNANYIQVFKYGFHLTLVTSENIFEKALQSLPLTPGSACSKAVVPNIFAIETSAPLRI